MAASDLGRPSVLYLDGGTTRTRAWACVGERVIASGEVVAGARDHARGGRGALAAAIRRLIDDVVEGCRRAGEDAPVRGVAAGMITAPEGLFEVAHVEAPADARDLARGAESRVVTEIASFPIVFVPGIRTGRPSATLESVGSADVMRGEEALALGLVKRGPLQGGGVLLSLGSHWKAVRVDAAGRVSGSLSSLSGELIESARSHTILASALPTEWPAALPEDWLRAGLDHGRRHGLPRAFYEVRLLEQRVASGPADRLAFLVGATVAASEDALVPASGGRPTRVVLAGPASLTGAWVLLFRSRGGDPFVLDDEDRHAAFRAGCRAVLEAAETSAAAAERRGEG